VCLDDWHQQLSTCLAAALRQRATVQVDVLVRRHTALHAAHAAAGARSFAPAGRRAPSATRAATARPPPPAAPPSAAPASPPVRCARAQPAHRSAAWSCGGNSTAITTTIAADTVQQAMGTGRLLDSRCDIHAHRTGVRPGPVRPVHRHLRRQRSRREDVRQHAAAARAAQVRSLLHKPAATQHATALPMPSSGITCWCWPTAFIHYIAS
jgi:hypothetical protein